MLRLSTRDQALIELLIAGLFWGFGFIGTVWALKELSPSAIIFYRFAISVSLGMIVLSLKKISFAAMKEEFLISFQPGLWLSLTLVLQTWGLQYTTATKSAFITILYVLIVPLVSSFFYREKIRLHHWVLVFISLFGVGLIIELQELNLQKGDALTFLCAIAAAFHILKVDKAARKSKNLMALNTFQGLWCCFFALCSFPFENHWSLSGLSSQTWIGILCLGFGSSFLAFLLQLRAQVHLRPALASLLFLLESPFSALFAMVFLNERMSPWQMLGAVVIFLSCSLASMIKQETPRE